MGPQAQLVLHSLGEDGQSSRRGIRTGNVKRSESGTTSHPKQGSWEEHTIAIGEPGFCCWLSTPGRSHRLGRSEEFVSRSRRAARQTLMGTQRGSRRWRAGEGGDGSHGWGMSVRG